MSIDQLYSDQIKAWAEQGKLNFPVLDWPAVENASTSCEMRSPTCGSKVIAYVFEEPNFALKIDATRACLLTQAASYALSSEAKDKQSIFDAQRQIERILSGHKVQGHAWRHLAAFSPLAEIQARHSSALLPFMAASQAVQAITNSTI